MLTSSDFVQQYRDSGSPDGLVVVVFLASFRPIGQSIGIPAVYRASEQLATVITEHAPPDSLVGKLSAWTYAVFMPGSVKDGDQLVTAIRLAGESRRFDVAVGEREPLYVTAGVVDTRHDNADIVQCLRRAARLAEEDQQRFPDDWRYPILLPDMGEAPE